jgi:hypothetical protein
MMKKGPESRMTPCLAPAKTDVAPQHNLQSIDLMHFSQTSPGFEKTNMLRDNNTKSWIPRIAKGFRQTFFVAPGGGEGDGSSLTNPGKS